MKLIINGLLAFGLTGCNLYSPPKYEQLNTLSNDELCRAFGTYNDESKVVLSINDILVKRKVTVNNERCHALEIEAKDKNKINIINESYNIPDYSRTDIKKDAELLRQINKVNH